MVKQQHLPKRFLKNIQLFRERQRKTAETSPMLVKDNQYRELEAILSPFWAWRGKSI